jgi:MFS family permease
MTTTTDLGLREPATAARGRWLMLIVLLAGQFMALLDVTIVNVAMPTIGRTLHASGAELQLVVAGYTVSYAMMLITGARLGDLYGRRRVFLAGVAVFTLASLTCGIAPGIGVLIGARFVQGAGAAAMMPQIMSVIQVRFDGAARGPGAERVHGRAVLRLRGRAGGRRGAGDREPVRPDVAAGVPGQRADRAGRAGPGPARGAG